MTTPKDIVYTYTHISGITILRNRDGTWRYHYTPIDVYRYLGGTKNIRRINSFDWMDTGEWIGARVVILGKRCRSAWKNSPN